jgi:hypothetical protein
MDIFENFFDGFSNPWYTALVIFAFAVILVLAGMIVWVGRYRSKRLHQHTVTIFLDGGKFQGSDEDLVFHAKQGEDIDLSRIVPAKKGYIFTGFNVYKTYVSSEITEGGIRKETVTKEELDGIGKDVVTVPDYDLYFVAKYTPEDALPPQGLLTVPYYPDFLSTDDLISDLKHLNYDEIHFPVRINFKKSAAFPNVTFLFKEETLLGMLLPYKEMTKVYFRTSGDVAPKLLTPFYHAEDINDAMNWYSFIVTYTTKPQRFLRAFIDCYNEIDESDPTSEIEFNLILGSLPATFADPVLDRALALTEQYEKDRTSPNPPSYVKNRDLPGSDGSDTEALKKIKEEAKEELEKEQKKQAEEDERQLLSGGMLGGSKDAPEKSEEVHKEEPAGEEKEKEEVPSEGLAEPKEEPKKEEPVPETDIPSIEGEDEDKVLEEEFRAGHFIQPKRGGRFLKWEKANKEEKIASVREFYKYHPEVEARLK